MQLPCNSSSQACLSNGFRGSFGLVGFCLCLPCHQINSVTRAVLCDPPGPCPLIILRPLQPACKPKQQQQPLKLPTAKGALAARGPRGQEQISRDSYITHPHHASTLVAFPCRLVRWSIALEHNRRAAPAWCSACTASARTPTYDTNTNTMPLHRIARTRTRQQTTNMRASGNKVDCKPGCHNEAAS